MARSRRNANQINAIDQTPIDNSVVGGSTPAAGSFTTLGATGLATLGGGANLSGVVQLLGSVSGAALTTYLASPAAIGGTAPNSAVFTTMRTTGAATLGGDVYVAQGTQNTQSATAALTAANIATGIIQYTGAAAGTLTLPLATALDTQFPLLGNDQAFDFSVITPVGFTATLAVNTGITAVGSLAVSPNTSGRFRLRKTATATYILYRLA